MPSILRLLAAFLLSLAALAAVAQERSLDYLLGAGDIIRIQVFQNPDLTIETRVSESGTVTYPLIGAVRVGGLSLAATEERIAEGLKAGGFVQKPQVSVLLLQNRGNQVSVLGQVNRPGRFPLEHFNMRLSELLAMAGGTAANGADTVVVVGSRGGKPFRKEVDLPALFLGDGTIDDMVLAGGDVVYVHRAPVFYIYGEAQRPGAYRIERNMTLQQALALGGGPTLRGTERIRLDRRQPDGSIVRSSPDRDEPVRPDDVIYVRESLF
jgi:polysaccharide export outer membrane protein